MRRRAWLLWLLGLSACGLPDGSARYAGLTVLDEPSGAYRIRYREPPWELVRVEGSTAELRVESLASSFVDVDVIDGGLPGTYRLLVTLETGGTAARADDDAARAPSRSEAVVVPRREVKTDSGDAGHEIITQGTDVDPRFRRYIYFERPGGVLRLFFEGFPDLDEPEVDDMVRSVDVMPGAS